MERSAWWCSEVVGQLKETAWLILDIYFLYNIGREWRADEMYVYLDIIPMMSDCLNEASDMNECEWNLECESVWRVAVEVCMGKKGMATEVGNAGAIYPLWTKAGLLRALRKGERLTSSWGSLVLIFFFNTIIQHHVLYDCYIKEK